MKLPRILIIGGGVTGLVCAHKLKNVADVEIVESSKLGGDFAIGETKYIHQTDEAEQFFKDLDVPFSNYTLKNGILLKGTVKSIETFEKYDRGVIDRVKRDYFKKTRLMESPEDLKESITEPSYKRPKKAIRVGTSIFLEVLVNELVKTKKHFSKIETLGCKSLQLKNDKKLYFDFLIFTIPLWEISEICWWKIPYCNARKRNLIKVLPLSDKDKYARWSHVYTPYTPENTIYRFSPVEDSYIVEVSGHLNLEKQKKAFSDLHFLFEDGWTFESIETSKGHMLEMETTDFSNWPKNISPVGMYAQWDEKITLDSVLDRVEILKENWGLV